jgi:DNA-binding SARP family transcriptional activator
MVAEAAIAARSGSPEEAEQLLAKLWVLPRLEPRERWWVTLMRAYAAARAGRPDAGQLASLAFGQAEALGGSKLPLYRERAVVEELAELTGGAGAARARALLSAGPNFEVVVLGGFRVVSRGEELVLPPGKPEHLVKVLAVSKRRLPAEVVIEHLWPEVEPLSGRKRLRNTLNRLRTVAPGLVRRSGEALTLDPSATLDIECFEKEATRALEQHHPGLARLVVNRYPGPVLPDDLYEDWAAPARERLSRLFLALLDAAAEEARAGGDFDEAVRHAERAIELDPYDELRYVWAGRILLGQGRRGATLSILGRARKALGALGVAPSGALAQLEEDARS